MANGTALDFYLSIFIIIELFYDTSENLDKKWRKTETIYGINVKRKINKINLYMDIIQFKLLLKKNKKSK